MTEHNEKGKKVRELMTQSGLCLHENKILCQAWQDQCCQFTLHHSGSHGYLKTIPIFERYIRSYLFNIWNIYNKAIIFWKMVSNLHHPHQRHILTFQYWFWQGWSLNTMTEENWWTGFIFIHRSSVTCQFLGPSAPSDTKTKQQTLLIYTHFL